MIGYAGDLYLKGKFTRMKDLVLSLLHVNILMKVEIVLFPIE